MNDFLVIGDLCYAHRILESARANIAGGGGVLELIFAGYVPLASQSPYPVVVYSVATYRPHLSDFWATV